MAEGEVWRPAGRVGAGGDIEELVRGEIRRDCCWVGEEVLAGEEIEGIEAEEGVVRLE